MTGRGPSLLCLAVCLLIVSGVGSAHADSFVKYNHTARTGACTPGLSLAEAKNVLRANGVSAPSASPAETIALARGIKQLQLLSGGRPSPHAMGMKFSFVSKAGYAQQNHKHITMSRGNSAGTANVGYLMHELGHQAGNNGLYAAYKRAVPSRRGTAGRCMVTGYCGKDYAVARERNEEFAEVWAAYLTNPAMLKAKGGACEAAYNFFRNRVFPNSKGTPCHDPGNGGINRYGERLGQLDASKCEAPYSARSNTGDLRGLSEYLGDVAHAQERSTGANSCGFFGWLFGTCKRK